jgi:[acyl-carrier-protein] S-malonyltransferase
MGRFGLVFPGQGVQHPGMGQGLCQCHQGVRELFAEAGNGIGRDMISPCFTRPQEPPDLTMNTQIALLTAVWRAFSERVAMKPIGMAGHSLGESAALHAASTVCLFDVLTLVRRKAQLHQEAVPQGEGPMAAILGLLRGEVGALCRSSNRDGHAVAVSIENAPGPMVVSGHTTASSEAIASAGSRKASGRFFFRSASPATAASSKVRLDGERRRSGKSNSGIVMFPWFSTAPLSSSTHGSKRRI